MTKSLVQQQFGAHVAAYPTSAVHAKGASLARLIELTKPHESGRRSTWQPVPATRLRRSLRMSPASLPAT